MAVAFILAFLVVKAFVASRDLISNWYSAWGVWAGGLTTTAAFLIAAGSIMVSSAHARVDRRAAADALAAEAMSQARLLSIYRVEMPEVPRSYVFFRVENRSNDRFFEVRVPHVDRVYQGREQHLVPPDPNATSPTMEVLPTGQLLTAYRTHTDHEGWFTEVRVYTTTGSRTVPDQQTITADMG